MSSNQFPYPEDFDNAAWTKARLSATANALAAPDGQVTADKLQETGDTGTHGIYDGATFIVDLPYTFSVYARKEERTAIRLTMPDNRFPADVYANFNLASGIVNYASNCTASCTSVGNDWFRCAITATCTVSGAASPVIYLLEAVNTSASYAGVVDAGAYIWGAKIEQASSAEPYQPVSPYISWLDPTTPEELNSAGSGAYLYLGDNEIRAIKSAVKGVFTLVAAPVSASPAEWNSVIGLESDWATQLAAKADTTHTHDTEAIGIVALGDGSRATTQVTTDDSTKVATTAFTKLMIAEAGLGAAWTAVATLQAASSTSMTFTATSTYDHYRVLSKDLRVHGTYNLELDFGTNSSWAASGYAWAVVSAGMSATAANSNSDTEIEMDGTANFGGGATSLDMRLFWPAGSTEKAAIWRMTGPRYGAYVALCGGGKVAAGDYKRMRMAFAGTASFSGNLLFLGRKR